MLPSEIEVFIKKKKDQCEKLIQFGIWRGIDSNNLRAWSKSFSSIDEKFFASCLLDWLVYRNEEQVISMLYDLFTKHLHNQWRIDNNPLYNESENPLLLLKRQNSQNVLRYVTAVTATDKGTKSGYTIVGIMNHHLEISSKLNIKNEQIPQAYADGVRTFLFVDDLTGTGQQMKSVLRESRLSEYDDVYVYVMLCAAHEMGYNEILKEFPFVKVLFAEYIPSDDNIFIQLPFREIELKDSDEFKNWYVEFMESKGVKKNCSLGRGDLGLAYAFQSGIPNDSLPILYYTNEKLNRLLVKRGT